MSSSYDLLHGTQRSAYLEHYGTKGMRWGVRKAIQGKIENRRQKIAAGLRKEAADYNRVADRIDSQIRTKPETELVDTINAEKKTFRKAAGTLGRTADMYEVDNEVTGKPIPGAMAKAKRIKKMSWDARDFSDGDFESDIDYTIPGSAQRKAKRASSILREVANLKKVEAKEWEPYDKVKHGDNMPDHLEHYGTKGMRWGVRKRASRASRKVKAYLKSADKKAYAALNTPSGQVALKVGASVVAGAIMGKVMRGPTPKKSKSTWADRMPKSIEEPPTIDWSKFPEAAARR